MAKRNGIGMIKSDKTMFIEMFETNKKLVNLIQTRTDLIELRNKTHKNLYNTTTEITELELGLKKIVEKLSKQIPS